MIFKSTVAALALCKATNAASVQSLAGRHEDVAAPSSMIFYNNCTFNVEMWKQGSAKPLNIAPGTEFRQHLGPHGGPARTYQFAPRGSSAEAGRLHVSYVFDAMEEKVEYGAAKIYSSLGDPFNNVTLSLGLTSSCGSGPGAASASASGLYTAVATSCGSQGAASFALGAGFCVSNGNQFNSNNNGAAAAAAAAANKGGSAAAAAAAASPGQKPGENEDGLVRDNTGSDLGVDLLRLL